MNDMEGEMQCAMEEMIEAYSSPYMATPDDQSLTGAVSALALMEICRQLIELNTSLEIIVSHMQGGNK